MRVHLRHLDVQMRRASDRVTFSDSVTFLYGPVGTGKSSVARMVDYCFGGELERTPAIQQEFVAVVLAAKLGKYDCSLERGAADTQAVRVTWTDGRMDSGSISATLVAGAAPLVGDAVFTLSDLLFYLCGVTPIKVPQRSRDPDSPMIRLSFRDLWWYCYLDQTHLDSSFFRLEDPFRGRKSQDAMRFFTGLHSERLSDLQAEVYRTIDEQQGAREAVKQIRAFMRRFELGSETELIERIGLTESDLKAAEARRAELEAARSSKVHPTDDLRKRLRELGGVVSDLEEALTASTSALAEEEALRAELITAKAKSERVEQAGRVLGDVEYEKCPQCGVSVQGRRHDRGECGLCGSNVADAASGGGLQLEATRRELNERIDNIADAVSRRRQGLQRSKRRLEQAIGEKQQLDLRLAQELERYDSAFVESIRVVDREIATQVERLRSLRQLQEMPKAIDELEERAGAMQGKIDRLRSDIDEERVRLRAADENVQAIAQRFKAIMLAVGFPGSPDVRVGA